MQALKLRLPDGPRGTPGDEDRRTHSLGFVAGPGPRHGGDIGYRRGQSADQKDAKSDRRSAEGFHAIPSRGASLAARQAARRS